MKCAVSVTSILLPVLGDHAEHGMNILIRIFTTHRRPVILEHRLPEALQEIERAFFPLLRALLGRVA
jgi:hypothetical protein